jgi:hypothetical protein
MISRSKINLREHTNTMELIKQIINPRQQILVIDGNRIQGTIIHAQPLSTDDTKIFTRARGPLAASAHEVGTAQVRVLIGCVFVEIVIDLETCHICRAVLLTI